jgi:hypothetical protein
MVIDGYTVIISNWIQLTLASVKKSLEMVNSKSATIRLKFDIKSQHSLDSSRARGTAQWLTFQWPTPLPRWKKQNSWIYLRKR